MIHDSTSKSLWPVLELFKHVSPTRVGVKISRQKPFAPISSLSESSQQRRNHRNKVYMVGCKTASVFAILFNGSSGCGFIPFEPCKIESNLKSTKSHSTRGPMISTVPRELIIPLTSWCHATLGRNPPHPGCDQWKWKVKVHKNPPNVAQKKACLLHVSFNTQNLIMDCRSSAYV